MEGCSAYIDRDADMPLESRFERSSSPKAKSACRTQRERSRSRDDLYQPSVRLSKEKAEELLEALLNEESRVESETKSLGDELSFGEDKVLLELRSEAPFVFRIADLDLPSRVDNAEHVVKLDLPSCFTGVQTLACKPQDDAGLCKQVTTKFKTVDTKHALALRNSGIYFIWHHDGMYLASMGGITASMFTPSVTSRKTRYDLEKQYVAPTVFFNFEDEEAL